MARSLMQAVREWQAEHKAGTAHPWGSCAHYTAASLLKELAKIDDPPKNFSSADNRSLQRMALIYTKAWCLWSPTALPV